MLTFAPNNLILNSAILTTQTVSVLESNYILSFKGTGSVTLSGAYTGSLAGTGISTRVSLKFTATTGNLTITISGSATEAQLERTTYETSPRPYISTTSTAYYGPRFDHDPVTSTPIGLRIEETRTNTVHYSQALSNPVWSKSDMTVIANATTAPDGTLTADKIMPSTANTFHQIYILNTGIVATGDYWSTTVYLKKAGFRKIGITHMAASGFQSTVDLDAETAVGNGVYGNPAPTMVSLVPVGDEWYKFTMTGYFNSSNNGFNPALFIVILDNSGNNTFAGNDLFGMFIWGVQTEAGQFPTSYIPTSGTAISRNSDVASLQDTSFTEHYNSYSGTFVAEFKTLYSGNATSSQGVLTLNSSSSQRVTYLMASTSNIAAFDGNTILVASGDATGEIAKSAVAHSAENSSAVLNGGIVVSANLSPMLWKGTMLNIGNTPNTFNGWIRNVKYYPNKLSDNQIKTMTS